VAPRRNVAFGKEQIGAVFEEAERGVLWRGIQPPVAVIDAASHDR
jgi:hypothetical protein